MAAPTPPAQVLPPELAGICIQQFVPDSSPSLYGIPVVLGGDASQSAFVLAPSSTERVKTLLTDAFVDRASGEQPERLIVTALCAAGIDDPLPVDAAVAYVAHHLSADFIVLNAEDLADGSSGIFGHGFCTKLWKLYDCFYALRSARERRWTPPSSPSSSDDRDADYSATPTATATDALEKAIADSAAILQEFLSLSSSQHPRRRILYLRNFSGMSAVFLPLVQALRRAISALPFTILVVVGIWPVARVPADSEAGKEYTEFLSTLHDASSLNAYVRERYSPQLRSGCDVSSLASIFTAALRHSHGLPTLGDSGRASRDNDSGFVFEHAFPVSIDVAKSVRPPNLLERHQARVVSMNVPGLREALRKVHIELQHRATSVREDWSKALSSLAAVPVSETVRRFSHVILRQEDLEVLSSNLAGFIPRQPSLADILRGMIKHDAAAKELQATLAAEALFLGPKLPALDVLRDVDEDLKALIVDPATIGIGYDDVCVPQHVSESLRLAISGPLLYPEAYCFGVLGEAMDGVLLYGPPGTGKTMLCCALAKEAGVSMLQVRASDIERMFVGQSEQRIRNIFTLARKLAPCIVFIDEIDALLAKHDNNTRRWERTQMTEFLQEMDGLKSKTSRKTNRVVVVGATNRPYALDDAVLRRLPYRIFVDLPAKSERKKILKQYLTGESCDKSVNIDALALRTQLFSGSELKDLVRTAAEAAFKDTIRDRESKTTATPATALPTIQSRVITSRHFQQAFKLVGPVARTNIKGLIALRAFAGANEEPPRSLMRKSLEKAEVSVLAMRRQFAAFPNVLRRKRDERVNGNGEE